MPAVGARWGDGSLDRHGTEGFYWSSTQVDSVFGYYLRHGSDFSRPSDPGAWRQFAVSIRCVRKSMYGKLFLPALGARAWSNGSVVEPDTASQYWSSVERDTVTVNVLYVGSVASNPVHVNGSKASAISIRCVR